MHKIVTAVVCFFLFFTSARAQTEKSFPFAHYNFKNGLASYNSNTIIQDRDGFIWVGTINGIQRFDGHQFTTFRRNPGDEYSLTDNYVDHLMYDSKGNLWVVLGNGDVGIFDTRLFRFTKMNLVVQDPRILRLPRKLMEDKDGALLYIIYNHETVTFDPETKEFGPAHNKIRFPPYWRPTSIVEDPLTRKYWVGTDSGMYVFNRHTKLQSFRGHNAERIQFIEKFGGVAKFFNLHIDTTGKLWFTNTPAGSAVPLVNCYDLKTNEYILYKQNLFPMVKKSYDVKRLLVQKNGDVWIAGLNVFMKFDKLEKRFRPAVGENLPVNIHFQEVNCMLEDRENNIWVSTDNNGLYVFKTANPLFTSVKHFNRSAGLDNTGIVSAISYNSKGEIMAGVVGDGIHRYDRQLKYVGDNNHTRDEKSANNIWSICQLKDGKTFWMGLQEGIMVYDSESGTGKRYNPEIMRNMLVRTIAQDKYGNMWLGCPTGGVFKWVKEKGQKNFEDGFTRFNRYVDHGLIKVNNMPNTHIEKITTDSKGYLWICTLMNGVFKIDPANDSIMEHITSQGPHARRLFADAVTDAFEYNDSIIIFPSGPLNFYNTRSRTITHVTSADGLPSDIVRSIEKDKKGYLWLAMFNGLCRMNVANKTFTYYDRNDGMHNDNFLYSSSCLLPDGRIAFGTTSDFIIFNPQDLNISTKPPNVTITGFEVLNHNLLLDSLRKLPIIELEPDQNFINISFSGLSYYNTKWAYYYQLEGLDKTWKRTDNQNQVSYNYLHAGNYTFKVRTESFDGVPSENITELKFRVEPTLLQSWWFYLLIALTLAIIIYLIDRDRMRRKKTMQKMRSDIADNLHEEVNTALNRINILSEMARLKSEKDPGKSTEYFDQIQKKSNDMIIAMDDMLWSINPDNDNMYKTIERIREYIDSMRARHAAHIDLLVDKNVETLTLNMKLRHDVFLIMKEGIRSVVQAGTKKGKIHMSLQKDMLLYTLEIDNKDVNLQQLVNALQQINLEKRLEAMNAKLHSKMHRYTSIFELYVPV